MTPLRWLDIWSALLAISLLTLCAARGAAQSPEAACDPGDPKSCVQGLTVGQPAPFTGMLLTYRRAAKLGVLAEGCQDRVDLGIQREKEIADVRLLGEQQLRENDRKVSQLQLDLLRKRLQEQVEELPPRWYERPAFVTIVTAAVTVGVLAMSVKAVQALK